MVWGASLGCARLTLPCAVTGWCKHFGEHQCTGSTITSVFCLYSQVLLEHQIRLSLYSISLTRDPSSTRGLETGIMLPSVSWLLSATLTSVRIRWWSQLQPPCWMNQAHAEGRDHSSLDNRKQKRR